ncbi:Na+/H+ antiporter NhaC family protein [Halobacteriovorax sp. RZ-1]|uniref:Na+/H+ antiporter NhaC family protein n=1 Tax=unclassified Halobacteriovorax TaxID=2639665 RepID=UPI00372460CB
MSHIKQKISLLPLLLFVVIYLGSGIYFQMKGVKHAFYQVPAPIAILPAILLAFFITKDTFNNNVSKFVKGIGHPDIITMCLIYLLAGAFSTIATETGGVDAIVNLGLSIIPNSLILPGVFVISALVSTAMGTSMGTIGAIGPIALSMAAKTDINLGILAGAVMSGAMFGDNLSVISDTTIAATRTQGCNMRDKFQENFKIASFAALIAIVVYFFLISAPNVAVEKPTNLFLGLPYFFILLLAILGVNVFVVLSGGIILAGIVALFNGFDFSTIIGLTYRGFSNMQEIFLLSLLIGGLSEFIRSEGGLDYISHKIQRLISKLAHLNKNAADQIGIGLLSALTNMCVANNTVSIIIVGPIAKKLAVQGNISPKRSASLIDIFSCVVQGLLPYGAQALLLGVTFKISPWEVVTNSYYCMILPFIALGFIFTRR